MIGNDTCELSRIRKASDGMGALVNKWGSTSFSALSKAKPDFGRLERAIRRQAVSDYVPFYDLFSDIMKPVLNRFGEEPIDTAGLTGLDARLADVKNRMRYMTVLGYDYVDVWESHVAFGFYGPKWSGAETKEGKRHYITSDAFVISARAQFDAYAWPNLGNVDLSVLDAIAPLLPSGMKVIFFTRGILETAMDLLGHEKICYMLYDDPALVQDIFARVGELYVGLHRIVAKHPAVGAINYCDDMGFKTQTLLSPQTFRELLFPWHKKVVENAHECGKPAILHACGNLSEVMEDIIDCGWDAKQSFEDVIEPVWEAKKKYGKQIALLGGFDMDKLSRMTVDEVRAHTQFMFTQCGAQGGWAIGTGNSVPNYIPVDNFLAMLDEGRRL